MHAAPAEEVLDDLRSRNIHNYSIFLRGDLLFSYFEYTGSDLAADMGRESEPSARWVEEVLPLLEPLPDRRAGEVWAEMEEVFHLD